MQANKPLFKTFIFLIIILCVSLIVGLSVWIFIESQTPKIPSSGNVPQQETSSAVYPTVTKQFKEWTYYKNDKYTLEFKYPKEWGELQIETQENKEVWEKEILAQQMETGVFSFLSTNPKIDKVWYHSKSKTLAFAEKGEWVKTSITGEELYQQRLFVGNNSKFSLIFEVPKNIAQWGGHIAYLSFSPNGK